MNKMATASSGAVYGTIVQTPVGPLELAASDRGLAAVLWHTDRPSRMPLIRADYHPTHGVLIETEKQLAEYFAGRRRAFDLPLDVSGTAFQREVWSALVEIPFGETRSYADIAKRIGRPRAVRAVGAANGRNPVSIVVPCHRVIGSTGALTGFGGGLEVKSHLLYLEGAGTKPMSAQRKAG